MKPSAPKPGDVPEAAPSASPSAGRRAFVGGGLVAAAAAALGGARQLLAAEPVERPPAKPGTSGRPVRWGMVIDLDRCDGCGACSIACRNENNVPIAGPEQTDNDRGIFWMDLLRQTEGNYPDLHEQVIPTPCNHCENPPCVKVCPVGATFISDEGIVGQIWARCIGCRFCTVACPYTRRYFNWSAPAFGDEQKERLNPDVATRPVGVVEKCTFCFQRIRRAREDAEAEKRQLRDADVRTLPACAHSCPTGAITFGDLADPESEVSRQARGPRAFRLQEELGTRPKVYYLRRERW